VSLAAFSTSNDIGIRSKLIERNGPNGRPKGRSRYTYRLVKSHGLRLGILSRRSLFAALCVWASASCAVYNEDRPSDKVDGGSASGGATTNVTSGGAGGDGGDTGSGGATGGSGGAGSSGGQGGATGTGGSIDGGSTGGSGGKGGGTGGASGGTAGSSAGGTGGSSTGGTGGSGTGGIDGGGGTAGVSGGAAGSGGGAGNGGAAGSGGAAGASGPGGTAGTSGTGGTSSTGGASGSAGSAGSGGSSGGAGGSTVDAGPDVPPPGAVFAVGSFVKSTATGTQTVTHTLGQTPKALILWTVGKTNESLSAGFLYGFGASDGTEGYSVGVSTRGNVNPTASSRRMAEKAITLVQGGETLVAEADLTSRTASNFALNWTTNDTQAIVIHYLAVGGPQASAKVAMWPSPTSTGNKAITGIGFRPETVLHFYVGAAFLGPPPSSTFNGIFGLGAMDKNGGQWSSQIAAWDDVNPSQATRGQQTDAAIFMYADGASAAVTKEASFVSMDSDGFTMNFRAANSNAGLICSLALAGVKASVGTFNKVTASAPATQSVSSAGFRPGAVLFSSYQMPAQTASISETTCSYGIGASDGTHEGSSAYVAADDVSPTSADGIDKTSKVFVKMNTPPEDAAADLTSFDASGFTLNWTTNDNVASQIGFWALAAP
jgi:hypothetical protein